MNPLHNPYDYAASRIPAEFAPSPSSHVLETQVASMLTNLGEYKQIQGSGYDNGTLALLLMCAFLREHGGTIHAMTEAHKALHQS